MEEFETGRERRKWPVVVAIVIALAALVAVGVWTYRETAAKSAAVTQLTEAQERLEAADTVVIDVDEVVRAQVEPSLGEKASAAQDGLDGARGDLSSAIEIIDDVRDNLPEEEVERADAIVASARARQDMLEQADEILDANVRAAVALGDANAGWDLVLEGEKLADSAVVEYNKLTKAAVGVSKDLSVQAERKLTDGRAKLDAAEKAFPAAGLEVFVNYVDQKLALLALSKKADEAFLAGKNAQANEFSNQYNTKDKEIIALAKKLPETPSTTIADAYEAEAGEATKAYFQAREEATKADNELREITQQ